MSADDTVLSSRMKLPGFTMEVSIDARSESIVLSMTADGRGSVIQRPNKAAWYAVSWHALDRPPGYDPGAAESFVRSAYKNAILSPSTGARKRRTAPSYGHHLEKPSTGQFLNEYTGRVGRVSAGAAEPQSEPEKCGRPARK
jgi:hypothetical protein